VPYEYLWAQPEVLPRDRSHDFLDSVPFDSNLMRDFAQLGATLSRGPQYALK
jgi:hypothetical protein